MDHHPTQGLMLHHSRARASVPPTKHQVVQPITLYLLVNCLMENLSMCSVNSFNTKILEITMSYIDYSNELVEDISNTVILHFGQM